VTLPTLPEVVADINRMLADPTAGVAEMGERVSRDPALTAAVLKIANSSFYGLAQPVLSAPEAAAVIGAHSLRSVVLQASIMKRYEAYANLPDFDLQELWDHCLFTAQLAKALSRMVPGPLTLSPEEFYTCGLLHDVGKVLLIDGLGEEYIDVVRQARQVGQALHQAERELLGFTHVDVGALLAARWELPGGLATAIQYHHGPRETILANAEVAVVSIADQVAYRAQSRTFAAAGPRLAGLARTVLGVPPAEFQGLLDLAQKQAENVEAW
jgi:putative nucleotidyltransferase with HDIG domain